MMKFTVLCSVACLLIQTSAAYHLPKDDVIPDKKVGKVEELQGHIKELAGENERLQSLLSEVMEEECVIGPRDCAEILEENPEARTGLHQIELTHKLGALESALVYCDMETDGGGWIVFQRRIDGSINFVRNRQSYADGFGIQAHEFWMGNKLLHQITSRWNYELRVDLEHTNGVKAFAMYSTFKVGSETNDFPLELSELVDGDAGDSLANNAGMKFSTFDHDVDKSDLNCAAQHNGAWWYRDCTDANLNGQHLPAGLSADEAMFWYTWHQQESLVSVEMKIRPAELTCPEPKPCPTKAPTTLPTHATTRLQEETTIDVIVGLHDCSWILDHHPSAPSGEYDIEVLDGFSLKKIRVWCDMETDGGGWTVFQRRQDGSVDFYRNYASYQQGFGSVSHEFWLGNDNLHLITSHDLYELRIHLEDFPGSVRYASYNIFEVGPGYDGYRLNVGNFSGSTGDSLSFHNGADFGTYDQNDPHGCAAYYQGGWWFQNCFQSHLNGVYQDADYRGNLGLVWGSWHYSQLSLKVTEMKVRPIVST